MPLLPIIKRIRNVSPPVINEMCELHVRYYCNVDAVMFRRDIMEKDWVIILLNENNKIAGFSTIQIISKKVEHEDCAFLFSGDTVVDRNYWQSSNLAGTFSHFMVRMLEEMKGVRCYWLLISKGYRTYRFLPVYFNRFFPVYSMQTPTQYRKLLDHICESKFNGKYNTKTGIIEFAHQKDYLKPEFGRIEPARTNDPHIKFFMDKNPLHYLGNELACIADISYDNFNRCITRALKYTKVSWDE